MNAKQKQFEDWRRETGFDWSEFTAPSVGSTPIYTCINGTKLQAAMLTEQLAIMIWFDKNESDMVIAAALTAVSEQAVNLPEEPEGAEDSIHLMIDEFNPLDVMAVRH
jgi:hypothetical protein